MPSLCGKEFICFVELYLLIFNCASIFFVLFTLLKYLFWLLLSKKKYSSKSPIYFICVQLLFLLKLF